MEKLNLEEAKKHFDEAQKALEDGAKIVKSTLATTVAAAASTAGATYDAAIVYLDSAQGYIDDGKARLSRFEDCIAYHAKSFVAFGAANPHITYPSAGTLALMALPATRRFLWRQTFGRFTRPEAVVQRSSSRVEALKGQVAEYGTKVDKLEQELVAAEEQMRSGYSRLRATRRELQRLQASVTHSESTANAVVRELRALKKQDNSLAIRGEAASHAAALKSQRLRITKGINRIVKQDV